MKTIVISDTAFLGVDYEDTINGLSYLKKLQQNGYKVIVLSNRPEYCMRRIGAYTPTKEKVYYRYLGAKQEKGSGIEIILFDHHCTLDTIHLHADFTIFGNGIKVFNQHDETVYEASYIESDLLQHMIQNFREYGYISYGENLSLQKDNLGDRCFGQGEKVYKFFTPEIGIESPNSRVYGMQCSGISSYYDDLIIEHIEKENPTIQGYSLNLKPCFYQRSVNKLTAFQNLLENISGFDLDQTSFILSEVTDEVLLQRFPHSSYCLKDDLIEYEENSSTLVKVLSMIEQK